MVHLWNEETYIGMLLLNKLQMLFVFQQFFY
jgi:hypothetical protein